MLCALHRWPRNSQRTALPTTSGAWSVTTRPMTPSITTSPRIWTAWAPRMCLCWPRTDLLCLSPAPSTTCQCLQGSASTIKYCGFESRGLRRFERLWSECFCKRNLKRNLSFHKTAVTTVQKLVAGAQMMHHVDQNCMFNVLNNVWILFFCSSPPQIWL